MDLKRKDFVFRLKQRFLYVPLLFQRVKEQTASGDSDSEVFF